MAGGLLMIGAGLIYLLFEDQITSRSKSSQASGSQANRVSRLLMGVQVGIIILTVVVTRSSVASLQAKEGLPLGNQVVGWIVLVTSLILPFVHRIAPNKHYLHRLVIIFLTFSPIFVLLTISYEGLFFVAFCATLLAWVRLETAIQKHETGLSESNESTAAKVPNGGTISSRPQSTELGRKITFRTLSLPDLRRALFFLFFLQSGFFSTGNIASVSSFSLEAVYRLIPVFDPFSQGALLVLKLMVPFAIISAALGILNLRLGLQSSALFMVVMAVSDVMTLNFFWMVKDEGSWLDIGTTISHFVIGSLICVFVSGLEGVSELLISGVEVQERIVQEDGVETLKERGAENVQTNGNGTAKVTQAKPEID